MILNWQEHTNIENSLAEFLIQALETDDLKVIDDNGSPKEITVRIEDEANENWTLPVINFYEDNRLLAPRLFVGSNRRTKENLIIIDIRALNNSMRANITDWLTNKLNDGFPYFTYIPKINDPQNPEKFCVGNIDINFLSNAPVRLGDNVDLVDKYRQRISISCRIEET